MTREVLLSASLVLLLAPWAMGNTVIMIKANEGKAPEAAFGCQSCHTVTPTRFHKFKKKELTEEGLKWVPKKKSLLERLLGKD
jgi:hypothetical protein